MNCIGLGHGKDARAGSEGGVSSCNCDNVSQEIYTSGEALAAAAKKEQILLSNINRWFLQFCQRLSPVDFALRNLFTIVMK